jgi:hypothetical protein
MAQLLGWRVVVDFFVLAAATYVVLHGSQEGANSDFKRLLL